jgi:hypothetical protein
MLYLSHSIIATISGVALATPSTNLQYVSKTLSISSQTYALYILLRTNVLISGVLCKEIPTDCTAD